MSLNIAKKFKNRIKILLSLLENRKPKSAPDKRYRKFALKAVKTVKNRRLRYVRNNETKIIPHG